MSFWGYRPGTVHIGAHRLEVAILPQSLPSRWSRASQIRVYEVKSVAD
jgi:hypothetical protein